MHKKKPKKRVLKLALSFFLLSLFFCLTFCGIIWFTYGDMIKEKHTSALQKVKQISATEFDGVQTSLIYDADGNILSKIKGDKETYYLRYNDIPSTVRDAFIAIEDHRFLEHSGF